MNSHTSPILFAVVAVTLLPGQGPPQHAVPSFSAGNPLAGAWSLVSIESFRPDGDPLPPFLGGASGGVLIYDKSGWMSVQVVRNPPARFAGDEPVSTSLPELADAFRGYYAYFGTFEVNEKEGCVVHHLKGSLRPPEVGKDYKRFFRLSGDELTLTTPVTIVEGTERVNRLVWKRIR